MSIKAKKPKQSAGDAAEGTADGLLKIEHEPGTPTKTILRAYCAGKLLHIHSLNLVSATARFAFVKAVARKAEEAGYLVMKDIIEQQLMVVAEEIEIAKRARAGNCRGPAYSQAEIPDDPDSSGIFRANPGGTTRLANFTARIVEDVTVQNELGDSRVFVGRCWLEGREEEFRIQAEDFGSGEKLKATLFKAAGPKAKILCQDHELRTAISDLSGGATSRKTTTANGWHQFEGSWVYATTNGHVDAKGFHKCKDVDKIQVDLGGDEVAKQICLRRLKDARLVEVREHIVEDFLQLHDRRVIYPLLAAVALAVLTPFAGSTQRFALWLKGLTGAGKSFAAKLAMNFFGNFDLKPDAGHFANWVWSANRIEKCGYLHRDAIFLVDDFKPELTHASNAVRVLQSYADGHGRGRLHADLRAATVWPIRGFLVATGEDLFQHHASALARAIVVDTPNRPKELGRGGRCLEKRHLYRGVMADFLAHLIREDRLSGFAAEVEEWRDYYYAGIAGRQNDSRIATNLGALAAALIEFGLYLHPAWPTWPDDVGEFLTGDLIEVRDTMLGLVEGQQASEIFLEELRRLVGAKMVRITDWSDGGSKDERSPVGRLFPGEAIGISMENALEHVQQSLKAQGRPALAISIHALLEQFCQDGRLLEQDHTVMTPQHAGTKTVRRRIVAGGTQIRVALYPRSQILPADDPD